MNTDPDPIRIRIQGFDDPILKKCTADKKMFLIKNYNLPIPRLP
jgi:hypothetical protein